MEITKNTKDALSWWNTLRNTHLMNGTKDKGYYADKYFETNMRMYQNLSTDEITMIYNLENHLNNCIIIGSIMKQKINDTIFKYEILKEEGEFEGKKFYQVRNIETEFQLVICGDDLY